MAYPDAIARAVGIGGRPVEEVLRHYLLEAIVRRMAPAPDLVLRGSFVTREFVAPFPRAANDLDLIGTFPWSVDEVAARTVGRLDEDLGDGVTFRVARCHAKGIWTQTAFPGVRVHVAAEMFGDRATTSLDVGFGDPLVPDPVPHVFRWLTGDEEVRPVVHPVTLLAWKLHGLAEWGHARWRPKDFLDLWLLAERFARPEASDGLVRAIEAAFVSRGYPSSAAATTLADPFWSSPPANGRWATEAARHGWPVPPLDTVRSAVVARLGPALAALG